ncbi:MAG: replication initiator protein [Microviridae sp.]|nr:MAG: replication initiator protein [Microviridae sp.]
MSHCLNPITIKNPRFKKGKKNGLSDPYCSEEARESQRAIDACYPYIPYIQIPCGVCLGCLRDKANEWRVRLFHEQMYGNHTSTLCLTLTVSDEYIEKFKDRKSVALCFRAFHDRLRYYTPGRRTPKHFYISELGEKRGRLHFHGFIWDAEVRDHQIAAAWRYGFICAKPLRSYKQLAYCAKYVTKPAVRWHKPMVFCSPGLGAGYFEQQQWIDWNHSPSDLAPINNCVKFERFVYAMPAYYRSKIFSHVERGNCQKVLFESGGPRTKILGRTSYTDQRSYQEAREALYQVTLRSGKSRVRKKKPHINSDLMQMDRDKLLADFFGSVV